MSKKQNTQQEKGNFETRGEELLYKFLCGENTIEESNELVQKSLAVALESVDVIRGLEKRLAASEERISMLDSATLIYQEFIATKEMNEEFADFYQGFFDEAAEENLINPLNTH